MNTLKAKTLILGLGFSLLGAACQNVPEVYKGALNLPEPQVSVSSTAAHQIQFSSGGLSDGEKAALRTFIYEQGIQYGDELSFDFATSDDRVWEKKQTLDDYLKTIGVWVDGVTQTGNTADPGIVTFWVTRYKATTPDCYALSRQSFVPTEMETNKIFGCLTASNLAAHVADKRDLVSGKPDTNPVASASVRAIQLYRAKFGVQIVQRSSVSGGSSNSSSF